MAFDHGFIRTHETDPAGKKVGNIVQTDPDADEVYLQKIVVQDPEDESDAGVLRITDGRAQVDAEVTGTVTANAGTNLNTSALLTEADFDTKTGGLTESAPGTDTASSGLNGRLQRIAQRLTSLIALLPTALGAGGGLKVDGSGTALPVSGTVTATATNLDIRDLTSASDSVAQRGQVSEATGALDADETTVELDMGGYAAATFTIVGDLVGTVIFEGKISDAADWGIATVYSQFYGGYVGMLSGGAEQFDQGAFIEAAGYDAIRLRCSAYTSGSSDVLLRAAVTTPIQRVVSFDDVTATNSFGSQADGHSETIGAKADAAYVSGSGTLVAILKGIFGKLPALVSGRVDVNIGSQSGALTTTASQSIAANLNMTEASASAIKAAVEIIDDWDESDRAKVNAIAGQVGVAGGSGTVDATTQRVVLATDVALPSGTNIIGRVGIDQTTPGTTNQVSASGPGAAASPTVGNPVRIGGRASNAVPTDVGADGDTTEFWTNRHGAPIGAQAPHVGLNGDPWSLVHEAAQYTGTQTSTVLIAGGGSEKLVVTKVQIQVGGTTAGTLQLYFGTGAFSRGTSRAIFDGEFAPSATLKPGVVMDGPFISGTNGDDLLVTTSAAINPLTINVWYYVLV